MKPPDLFVVLGQVALPPTELDDFQQRDEGDGRGQHHFFIQAVLDDARVLSDGHAVKRLAR